MCTFPECAAFKRGGKENLDLVHVTCCLACGFASSVYVDDELTKG